MRRTMLAVAALAAAVAALVLLRPMQVEVGVQPSDRPASTTAAVIVAPNPMPSSGARAPVVATPTPTKVDFEMTLNRLVELALRAVDEVARHDIGGAEATDAQALALVKSVLEHVPDYEDRALFALTGLSGVDDARATLTRRIIERFLYFGLQKLDAKARGGNAARCDAFQQALLDSMVPDERTAAIVTNLLADQPYLNAAQESALLRLVDLVPTYPWLADPMRRLLLTLWRNLEASGARPRDRLETLALMLKDDTNPARRAAALEHLLTSNDRSLVDFVLQDIEEQRDASRAHDLAAAAVAKLSPELALQVVRRLRAVSAQALTGPAIELARRDAVVVRAAYQQALDAGHDQDLRADLVAGLGFNPGTDNLAMVKTAFERDPDPGVRRRALLALTANAAAAFGEQVVQAALADRELCGKHGERLGTILAALENLASAGERDAARRLGEQMDRRPDLPPDVRTELARFLKDGPRRPELPKPSVIRWRK